MQIYANHIQIHLKIASCVPPHLLENYGGFMLLLRVMSAFPPTLAERPTPGRR